MFFLLLKLLTEIPQNEILALWLIHCNPNTIEFNPYDLALENVKPKTINDFSLLHLDPTNEI